MAKKYFTVSTYQGTQMIIAATNLLQAEALAAKRVGTDNLQVVVESSEAEIQWQQAMGGYLPPLTEGE